MITQWLNQQKEKIKKVFSWLKAKEDFSYRHPCQIYCKMEHSTQFKVSSLLDYVSSVCQIETVVDVGCNKGKTIKQFDALFHPKKIYGFEPDPSHFSEATKVHESNERVELFQVAVSDFEGKTVLNRHPTHSSDHSLLEFDEIQEKIPVTCWRLDAWAKRQGVEKIDFLKIDTQGNDFEVIKGAGEKIKTVQLLLAEVWFSEGSYKQTHLQYELTNYLSQYDLMLFGFSCLTYRKDGKLVWGDAIFLKKSLMNILEQKFKEKQYV